MVNIYYNKNPRETFQENTKTTEISVGEKFSHFLVTFPRLKS